MKISLVILTLNEIDGVKAMLPRAPLNEVDEVFVVDGGSTDGTREFFEERGIRVVPQKSAGRGEAFRIAMENITGDAAVFFSPDGNENPADFPKFKKFLEEGYDIVIGSRMMKGAVNEEDIYWWRPRKWANQAFTLLANLIWNTKFLIGKSKYITDTINGYRAITRDAWNKIHLDGPGFTIEYQMSIRALKLGLKIKEFPTIEGQRIGRESGCESLQTGIQFLKLLLREIKIGKNF
jgi:glycosyltransferase involved in cell wall biosynthesis